MAVSQHLAVLLGLIATNRTRPRLAGPRNQMKMAMADTAESTPDGLGPRGFGPRGFMRSIDPVLTRPVLTLEIPGCMPEP